MEPVELSAAGLLLRAWQPEDAAEVFRACQDPLIHRWTNVPVPYLPRHAEQFVGEHSPAGWNSGCRAPFGVFDAETGVLLGSHGLIRLDRAAGTGEIGLWTAPWARGQGVAQRASRAVARWALDVLRLRVLIWHTKLGNHTSRLVAERIGFAFDGPIRDLVRSRGGRLVDGWRGTLHPGEIRGEPSAWLAPGAPGAVRARVFAGHQPCLDAGAVRLRPPAPKDIDPITAACSDRDAVRWTNIPVPYTRADAEQLVETVAPRRWARADAVIFTIADPEDVCVGRIDLYLNQNPDDPRIGAIAFLITPDARSRGYATAAVRTACRWGFEALGLSRIIWRAHVGNIASRRVAEKAGFQIEGVERSGCDQRGERRDAWVAALTATDCSR
jgi:RimJ/RimL family protein N-acetyltransferase